MTWAVNWCIVLLMLKGLIFSFGSLMIVLSIIFWDQPTSQWFALPEHESIMLAARAITDIGLGENWFIFAFIVFVMSTLIPRRHATLEKFKLKLKNWSIHFFVALLISGIILHVTKFIFGRQRPHKSAVNDPLVFVPFNLNWHFQSFPSGHTQVLFCAATCFSLLAPRLNWVFYLMAAGLSFTRVMTEQHFLSDVIGGALIGTFATLWSISLLQKKVPKP